ncbi:HpsJ family protein [Capilliphycus salinus ALCB114379]|uniref:HpsJ-like protein, cyanoexosortase A-associated n=1 Tax=Capilliphycus salinus TaxID=2768948 RepID=UPI0039A5BFAC
MTQVDSSSSHQSVEVLRRFNISLLRSINLVRWVGYGFLVLSLFDLIDILYPPDFMNPSWELQTMGQLVERVAVPLLAFVLIFFGERNSRDRWEIPVLNFLSWFALVYGIIFLLLIPLGLFNTLRIDRQANQQLSTQVNQVKTQIQQVQDQLKTVNNPAEMEDLLSRINPQAGTPEIESFQQFEDIKTRLSTVVANSDQQITTRAKEARSTQRQNLLKRSIKWNLGALITSALFITIWKGTVWARQKW